VTVSYATANGSATTPSDYASASGTLTFAPGETAKPIVVAVNGDTAVEFDETFTVTLSGATNALIADGTGIGTITSDDLPPAVQWTSLVGATASGGSLTRGAGAEAWNAGAVSRQTLLSGDGYVEFVANETTSNRMLGLGNGDASQTFMDIEFAVYLRSVGTFAVYESGVARTGFVPYAAGDRFRVGVESGVVKYRRNGVLFYTSSAPSYPLLVDTSLYTPGATLSDARVLGFVIP
jgi:hypothetical protein